MKYIKKQFSLVYGYIIKSGVFCLAFVFCTCIHYSDRENKLSESDPQKQQESFVEFSTDSVYKVVYDSVVSVWNEQKGKKISTFHVNLHTGSFYPGFRQMELAPSGKYLAFVDNFNIISVYNVFTGECIVYNEDYADQSSHISFSDDMQYFLVTDYTESLVHIFLCPGFEYLATGEMGVFRNNFYWKSRNGKLYFFYEDGDKLYQTIFPVKSGKYLTFSKPLLVGKARQDNSEE